MKDTLTYFCSLKWIMIASSTLIATQPCLYCHPYVCFLSYPIYTLEDRLPIKTLGPGAPQISDPAPPTVRFPTCNLDLNYAITSILIFTKLRHVRLIVASRLVIDRPGNSVGGPLRGS